MITSKRRAARHMGHGAGMGDGGAYWAKTRDATPGTPPSESDVLCALTERFGPADARELDNEYVEGYVLGWNEHVSQLAGFDIEVHAYGDGA